MPCSPSRAATVSKVDFTPSCGVTAAQAVRYSYAADSARETAFSSPRYDGFSDMSVLRSVWREQSDRRAGSRDGDHGLGVAVELVQVLTDAVARASLVGPPRQAFVDDG